MSKKDFYTIKFPLEIGMEDIGYQQISDFKELVEYNMKSTLLTCPGEIISDPQFGVCIRKVLFENPNTISNAMISEVITNQISKYIPYISLRGVRILNEYNGLSMRIQIRYSISSSEAVETFEFSVELPEI